MDSTFYLENNIVFNYRVAAVMIEKGYVLIHKQTKDNHWALPGGRVEVLEDSQSSVKRELKEELNVEVKIDQLLWFSENFFEYKKRNFHELGLFYKVSPVKGSFDYDLEPFYGEEGEHVTYQWVPIAEIDKILLYPEFLQSALKNLPETPEQVISGGYEIKSKQL
ncbi:NUDIX hydrolase [Halalkalibacillus sediminis]|uniref:NUDIX hydrolase n=1 Tax=Halalkalibacillus sediminis TaxID=2018042 RepID=A0A2I0QXV1_9BACI|nr:NUDIX domain-containing protein [Halalkalibacillus sediminis]PKR79161.1 NUDIX hydrolase [Halalkalibacillus sediminis]